MEKGPFTKPKPPEGWRHANQMRFPYNNNSEKEAPTNASDSFKPKEKKTFGITKNWQNEKD